MDMSEERHGSLLSREARGGDIAGAGFAFQDAHILQDIPMWLARDGFTAMIREGLGDAEARFFDPLRGEQLVLAEMKSARLTPAPFWREVERFLSLDRTADAYERFELVAPGYSAQLATLADRLERIKKAGPFYDGVPEIQQETTADFVESCVTLGASEDQARLLLTKVAVRVGAKDETTGFQRFQSALTEWFPVARQGTQDQLRAAHDHLLRLIIEGRGRRLERSELEAALWNTLPSPLRPSLDRVRLHFEHDAATSLLSKRPDIRFHWARFFGGSDRSFPSSQEWTRLVEELAATRMWIQEHGRPRLLRISGFLRLSAAYAVGAAFPEVAGFQLEADVRGSWWRTSSIPPAADQFAWQVNRLRRGASDEVAVSIGLPRRILPDAEGFLTTLEDPMPHIALHFPGQLTSGAEVDRAAAAAKGLIAEFIQAAGASTVNLFLATPAVLALFLGHRVNAVGAVQCHEFCSRPGLRADLRLTGVARRSPCDAGAPQRAASS